MQFYQCPIIIEVKKNSQTYQHKAALWILLVLLIKYVELVMFILTFKAENKINNKLNNQGNSVY